MEPKEAAVHESARVEKFTSSDLVALHTLLTDSALENGRASELLADFLRRRGYGVHAERAEAAVFRMDEEDDCAPEQVQAELERVALVM